MEYEQTISRIVHRKNSIVGFLFLLIVNLFFYLVVSISSFQAIRKYGETAAIVIFAIALYGLLITSFNEKSQLSRLYYLSLLVVSALILFLMIFSFEIFSMVKYFYILAVLIALLISLLDYWESNEEIRVIREYGGQVSKMSENAERMKSQLQKQKEIAEQYKSSIQGFKDKIGEKTLEVRQAEKRADEMQKIADNTNSELEKSKRAISYSTYQINELKGKNKKLAKDKKKAAELADSRKMLERELEKRKQEIERQAELKRQYSHSLRSIRKHKKEDEELLVVSPDGKSVHRPKCISVRHILKESRKLIKNWATAKKEHYKGCKLCKPHIKPMVIVKNNIKYKLVASKLADKVHKVSCTLARNIDSKERVYFRTYRAAIKKGFTACRVCNPEQ